MRRILLLRPNRGMRRNERNDRGRDEAPEEINEGISLKHVLIILIIGIGVMAFWRTSGHVFSFTSSPVPNVPSVPVPALVPTTERPRSEPGRGRAEPLINSYEAEAKTMQRIITKYASMQRAGEKNETVEKAGKPQGKTGTFVLNTGDETDGDGDGAKDEEEEQYEDLDPVDLAFIDTMIEDIQETDESIDRKILELRVNELEQELGRKLTKYQMTAEELDADTTLDEDTRQIYEFRNVRHVFVWNWIRRMRELKIENNEKYNKLPHEYTMVQKINLKNSFETYVGKYWDKDTKRQKRNNKNKSPTRKSPPSDPEQNIDKDKEIKEILEAIHYTKKYELKQDMEDELAELKSMQGLPPPKVDMKEHIKNNFIYGQREKRENEGFKKKSISEYSALEIEELKITWEEYFKFYKEKHGETDVGVELTLSELHQLDDIIDAIERTPRYLEKEYHRKRLDELDELKKENGFEESSIFNQRDPDDPEPTEFDNEVTDSIVDAFKEIRKLEDEFIKEERARLQQSSRTEDRKESTDDDNDDYYYNRDSREPEDYSLAEKVQLQKRFELFKRNFFAKSKVTFPRPPRNIEENSEALENNKLDYLDELVEDIHRIHTPAHEARLDVEAMAAKHVKTAPDDRQAVIQLQYLQMRRKFINEERLRLVTKLTEFKTPKEYTFDAKEELRCRWVDFYEINWSPQKEKEIKEFGKIRKEKDKQQGKNTGKMEEKLEEDEENLQSEFETELMNHLIDEIYDQNEFSRRKKLMKEYDEHVENHLKIKEQLILQKEGGSMTPVDKIIHEFAQKSLSEFLKMREKFILNEKEIAKDKSVEARSKGLNQFLLMPSDMTDIMKRWKVTFRTYKTKVDKLFQTLGN